MRYNHYLIVRFGSLSCCASSNLCLNPKAFYLCDCRVVVLQAIFGISLHLNTGIASQDDAKELEFSLLWPQHFLSSLLLIIEKLIDKP